MVYLQGCVWTKSDERIFSSKKTGPNSVNQDASWWWYGGAVPPHSSRVLVYILRLGCCLCGVSCVLHVPKLFPPTSTNILLSELLNWTEVRVWVCSIQGVFLSHVQCSQDRVWIHCNPHQDKVVSDGEWMDEKWFGWKIDLHSPNKHCNLYEIRYFLPLKSALQYREQSTILLFQAKLVICSLTNLVFLLANISSTDTHLL